MSTITKCAPQQHKEIFFKKELGKSGLGAKRLKVKSSKAAFMDCPVFVYYVTVWSQTKSNKVSNFWICNAQHAKSVSVIYLFI